MSRQKWSVIDGTCVEAFTWPIESADGRAGIVDQDEFDQLANSGHLNDSHVVSAAEAAHSLLPLVQMKTEPFGEAARPWLRALRS